MRFLNAGYGGFLWSKFALADGEIRRDLIPTEMLLLRVCEFSFGWV